MKVLDYAEWIEYNATEEQDYASDDVLQSEIHLENLIQNDYQLTLQEV
jgi:uncharacterized protein YkwD